MKNFRVTVNGNVYDVSVEEIESNTINQSKQNVNVPIEPKTESNLAEKIEGTKINSPMPGVVTDILVSVGDIIKKDQAVVVLEAMKMLTEIVSPIDGKIVSISTSKGSSVNTGELMVTVS